MEVDQLPRPAAVVLVDRAVRRADEPRIHFLHLLVRAEEVAERVLGAARPETDVRRDLRQEVVADEQHALGQQEQAAVPRRVAGRPHDLERTPIAQRDLVLVRDQVIGLGRRVPGAEEAARRRQPPVGRHHRDAVAGEVRGVLGGDLRDRRRGLGLEGVGVDLGVRQLAIGRRRAEVVDVMVRRDEPADRLRVDADLVQRAAEGGDAVLGVHPRVDQRPPVAGAHEVHVHDARAHGERQVDLHHPVDDLPGLRRLAHATRAVAPGRRT